MDIQNLCFYFSCYVMLSGNFYGSEIRYGIFWGVLIFAPIQSSLSIEIWGTPPGVSMLSRLNLEKIKSFPFWGQNKQSVIKECPY